MPVSLGGRFLHQNYNIIIYDNCFSSNSCGRIVSSGRVCGALHLGCEPVRAQGGPLLGCEPVRVWGAPLLGSTRLGFGARRFWAATRLGFVAHHFWAASRLGFVAPLLGCEPLLAKLAIAIVAATNCGPKLLSHPQLVVQGEVPQDLFSEHLSFLRV